MYQHDEPITRIVPIDEPHNLYPKVVCGCGMLYSMCSGCGNKRFCFSCRKCFSSKCKHRKEQWRLDPKRPIRFDMKAAERGDGKAFNPKAILGIALRAKPEARYDNRKAHKGRVHKKR